MAKKSALGKGLGDLDPNNAEDVKRLSAAIEELETDFSKLKDNASSFKDPISAQQLATNIEKAKQKVAEYGETYSAIKSRPDLVKELNELQKRAEDLSTKTDLKKFNADFEQFNTKVKQAGLHTKSLGDKLKDAFKNFAQYELTLLDWVDEHKGYRKYVAIAGKCWPAFQTQFGFVPCYVNSRLTGRGIPVSCEVDIYGALSEFIGTCVSEDAVTLLDINNSVPKDMYKESIEGKFDYTHKDTFMGFHCGNTCSKKLASCEMKNQMIMARSLPVEVTNGTLEGDIAPGDITFYRLQSTSDNKLRAYVAQGEVLPVATRSFGSIGVFAIHEMGRFYRHVLIEKNYPHHGAVAFGHYGKALFEVFKYIGVPMEDINYNQPASLPYPTENPFA